MKRYSEAKGIVVVAIKKNEGLTIREMAERIGYNEGSLKRGILNPSKQITLKLEQRLRETFNLSEEDLAELIRITEATKNTSQTQRVHSNRVRASFAWVDEIHVRAELAPFIDAVAPLIDKWKE
ncbi:hypothetical protein SD70_31965 [Gordoniibacillus kamchatkensis]|uniref:HTH cro/C1-type domain-containing protein n=1 Tax=Gordoniibacillus kamchatkensis TaxID=1590651 RepID=A0ABR5A504_9BACL|nr:hypothetical protein [Paenibacillus sp. VKM B-2647]KIL35733.1 hypothetical protein SD70_31965 [Paenibacillus sp. VKM B-2647]